MSHLWDGFRMGARTIDEAMDVVDRFRPKALRLLMDWNARLLADAASALIDGASAKGLPLPLTPLSDAWSRIQERRLRIVRSEVRDPIVDPEFRLTLIRYADRIHGLDHSEQKDWRSAWRSFAEVDDFSWWNGSDRPDDVSEGEWDARAIAWSSMIPDGWPAGHGVVVHLTPRYFDSSPDEVLAAMPALDVRVRRVAVDLALTDRMKQISGESKDASTLISAASSASSWIASKEGVAECDRIGAGLSLPTIDLPTLLGFDPENRNASGQKDQR